MTWLEHPFDTDRLYVRFTEDINSDGAADLVYTADGQHVWREFDGTVEHPIGNPSSLRSVVDLNGDESPDFFAVLDSGECGWYENDGTGGFTEHVISGYKRLHSFTDANGDGFMDVLVTFNDDESGWYENDGNGNFTARKIPALAENYNWLRAADMNQDGHMDFLSRLSDLGTVTFHLNDGNGSFTDHPVATRHGVCTCTTLMRMVTWTCC